MKVRQPAWLKPNIVKSLQSSGNNSNWRRTTYRWQNPTYPNICWNWKWCRVQRLWSSTQHCLRHRRPIALLWCSNKSWTNVWWTVTIVLDISMKHWQTGIECEVSKIHAFTTNDSTWHVQVIDYEPWFSSKYCALSWVAYLNGCVLKREITVICNIEATISNWFDTGISFKTSN